MFIVSLCTLVEIIELQLQAGEPCKQCQNLQRSCVAFIVLVISIFIGAVCANARAQELQFILL